VQAAVHGVLDSMKLFLGENVFQLERDFAKFCGAKHAVGVGSGTDALYLALRALEIGPGDEVITVPNSFFATAAAICMTGATPVFVDVDQQTFTMDPEKLEPAITDKAKAIIPVHLYGQPADMRAIKAVADAHKLAIIEARASRRDAAASGRARWATRRRSLLLLEPGPTARRRAW
jgi:dTDP-4-amino-4,6-dideoxygalactose transaminase